MSADKSNQLLIREAIRKIALGRSMERIDLAPGGMSGIGTARMVHGYVAKIHDNPSDSEYSEYAGTIDVGEYPDETASSEDKSSSQEGTITDDDINKLNS